MDLTASIASLNEKLGVQVDATLLTQALTHRSYAYENGGIPNSERLEFLGDSVLGFVVTEHIYHLLPDLNEGELTKVKNSVVSEKALSVAAKKLGLGEYLRLGKGEELTGGRTKPSLLCDAFESVLGAVLLSAGFEAAYKMVETHIFPLLADPDALRFQSDPKTSILELAQARNLGAVSYDVAFEGPDHDRRYFATIHVGDGYSFAAEGRTKKAAETAAAEVALSELRESTK
ncbi:MAG: ribonuclease III [Micrococcales bacterium]